MYQKSLLITRSGFIGSGKFGGKWSGDNNSNRRFMELSISHMI